MSDELITRLRERSASATPSPTAGPATDDLIRADLARGRSAVRRHRYRQSVGALGACAVAGVVAAVALNGTSPTTPPQAAPSPVPSVISSPPPAPATPAEALQLVAYEGAQPEGFRLTTVPEGFRVIGSEPYSLVLAGPNDPGTHPGSYADRVVVTLASPDAPKTHTGTQVKVGDHDGVIWETGDHDGTRVLSYTDADGHPVDIQVWKTISLSDAHLVAMAEGVTVTDDVVQSVG